METFLVIVGVVVLVRLYAWMTLRGKCNQLAKIVKSEQIVNTHGRTVGELELAGVLNLLRETDAKGGALYRSSVPFASFLMWWPIGPIFRSQSIREAFATGGFVNANQMGAYEIWHDLRRGHAFDTNYYHTTNLKGMLAALNTARLVW